MLKIKLHSATDLITNSSTVIFTYSEGTIKPLKEMIDEIAKVFGFGKTCDEMFDTLVLCEDESPYEEYLERLDEDDYPEGVDEGTDVKALFESVCSGEAEKPEWFTTAEESEEYYDDSFRPSTTLYLIPKEEKYRKMADLIESFLYSPDHEATRDR